MLHDTNLGEVLFIDIETVPFVPEFNGLNDKWKQLWEHKVQYNRNNDEPVEMLYNRAGIYAEFGRIICISAGYINKKNDDIFFRVKSFYDEVEKDLILHFFNDLEALNRAGKRKLCAHNGQEFDFPYIARRALVNNVRLPKIFDIAGSKPWEIKDNFIDTLQLWKFGDYKHYTSLSLLCELFNIPTPKDDIDGSEVANIYWEEKNLERIVRYCEKDTLAVANLMLKYKGEKIIPVDNMIIT
jgi:3'-5' exonuclease